MNRLTIIDIILIAFGLIMILCYAKRGFFKSVIHSLKGIIALVLAYFFGGRVAAIVSEKFISEPVRDAVFKKVDSIYQSTAGSVDVEQLTTSFPDFIMTEEVQSKIASAEGTGESLVNSVTDAIASPIATVISNVIGYVLVFLVALIGLWIIASILDKIVDHLLILSTVNKLLGGVLGAIIAAVILFVVGSVMKYFFAENDIYVNSVILKFFGESSLLETHKFLDVGSLLGGYVDHIG